MAVASIRTAKARAAHFDSALKIAVGGYAAKITTLGFDLTTYNFQELSTTAPNATGQSPSFLSISCDGRFVFVSNEVSDFEGRQDTGSVSSFRLLEDGSFEKISTAVTGADPVSLMISSDGRNLIVADYSGGSWSRHSVDPNGAFSSSESVQSKKYNGHGPNLSRQSHSFLHQAVYDPSGRFAFFVDFGADSIYVHWVDQASGQLSDEPAHVIQLEPGLGPRHLSLVITSPRSFDIYVICELGNTMLTVKLVETADCLQSKILQSFSTLPAALANETGLAAGEVAVSGDGRFVYGTNRQSDATKPASDNSFVVFTRNILDGTLDPSPNFYPLSVDGHTPRHFSFSRDPEQSLVVIGCQQANKLHVYQRNPADGSLELKSSTTIDSPAVQFFLPSMCTLQDLFGKTY